jgi:hypothetical protein
MVTALCSKASGALACVYIKAQAAYVGTTKGRQHSDADDRQLGRERGGLYLEHADEVHDDGEQCNRKPTTLAERRVAWCALSAVPYHTGSCVRSHVAARSRRALALARCAQPAPCLLRLESKRDQAHFGRLESTGRAWVECKPLSIRCPSPHGHDLARAGLLRHHQAGNKRLSRPLQHHRTIIRNRILDNRITLLA